MRKFGKETFQIKKNGAKKEKEKKRRERLQKRRFMRFGLLQSGKRRVCSAGRDGMSKSIACLLEQNNRLK